MPISCSKLYPANHWVGPGMPPARLRATTARDTARKGFTLIELLVSISIILLLASMLALAGKFAQASIRSMTCTSNLRQLSIASLCYAQDNRGFWPMSWWSTAPNFWGLRIGEYIEGFSGAQYVLGKRPPTPFGCPESQWIPDVDDGFGCDFSKNVFAGGYGYNDWVPIKRMATYPAATTIGYGDGEGGMAPGLPSDRELAPWCGPTWGMGFWRHRSKANAVFLDGHTQSLSKDQMNFTAWDADPWNLRYP